MNGPIFDATQYEISQGDGSGSHPPGKFPFLIVGTQNKPTKENDGGYLEVEFETPAGRTKSRFNLWNTSAKAVEIAHQQLAALCYAVGRLRIDVQNNSARELIGGRGQLEVRKQQNSNYTEVFKYYFEDGAEVNKERAPQQQGQQPQQGFQQQQPQGQPQGGWGGNQPQQQQPQQQNNGGWTPGSNTGNPGGGNVPPWGQK